MHPSPTAFPTFLRWTARLWSLLAIAFVLAFMIGEELNLARFTPHELVLFAFFPVGVCAGLVLAWRHELAGGTVTVASLAAFYLANRAFSGRFPGGLAFLAVAAPGLLFLCWAALTAPARR